MLSLPAKLKRSDQEQPRKSGDIVYPIISLWGFFRLSRAANSAVSGTSRPKFKVIRALMHVISTCKYEKDRIKNSREKSGDIVFSIIIFWEVFLAMKTGVLIRSGPKCSLSLNSMMLQIKFGCVSEIFNV